MMYRIAPALCLAATLIATAVSANPVTPERLMAADGDEWLSHGRDYSETRFSPLADINTQNVNQLGLAWSFEYPDNRGLEATPIVADGVLYTSGAWSRVFALDATTGETLWSYDPKVPKQWGVRACCGPVNRGVAVWEDKVFVGTLDGYLVALDRATGAEVWRTLTIDPAKDYSITGAPRVVKGRVLIGNGGAELGVRGYVSAYDVQTGELAWRFYTVPGNPADGFENAAMENAAKTWNGEWWKLGGGGTVWDSMAFDPQLNLVYIGVGNGSPWNQHIRSPGGGDNLYLSSIVALNADTGEYVWHYQTTPGEMWDYTATQQMILADIAWQGQTRQVIMQAPKNGFFFIVDRTSGEFLSAIPFAKVQWATHYDDNGRPVETPKARYQTEAISLTPAAIGSHNWHSMSYSPQTGLVYIPVLNSLMEYDPIPKSEFKPHERHFNIGVEIPGPQFIGPRFMQMLKEKVSRGELVAWDPRTQQRVWSYKHQRTWNGGTLATAGGLVFQGTADQQLMAFDATNGKVLWQHDLQLGVIAAPVTYRVNGEQYVAINAKWGGAFPLAFGVEPMPGLDKGRLLVFKLNGEAVLPEAERIAPKPFTAEPPALAITDKASLAQGKRLYDIYCARCHGNGAIGGGITPDLRHMDAAKHAVFKNIVHDGLLEFGGMVGFKDILDEQQTEQVRNYILQEAHASYEEQKAFEGWWGKFRWWWYDKLSSLLAWLADKQ